MGGGQKRGFYCGVFLAERDDSDIRRTDECDVTRRMAPSLAPAELSFLRRGRQAMQKKNEKKAPKQVKSQKRTQEPKAKEQRVIEILDLELEHVTGGLAFCTTPWD